MATWQMDRGLPTPTASVIPDQGTRPGFPDAERPSERWKRVSLFCNFRQRPYEPDLLSGQEDLAPATQGGARGLVWIRPSA